MKRLGVDDGIYHPASDEGSVCPNPVQWHETGRRSPPGVGPLQDHAVKEADVTIREDSADKKEDTLGLWV